MLHDPYYSGRIGMILAGVGHSTYLDMEQATRRACSAAMERLGRPQADFLLCFATPEFASRYSKLFRALEANTGTSNILGCSAMAVITGEGEFEGSPGLAVMAVASDEVELRPFLAEEGPSGVHAIAEVWREAVSRSRPRDNQLLLLLTDVFRVHASDVMAALHRELGWFPMVGAAASGRPEDVATFQWVRDHAVNHGLAGMVLSGPMAHYTRVSQGCEPIGGPCVITQAEGGAIRTIGNRPAYDMLREALAIFPQGEVERVSKGVFAGIMIDGRKHPPGRGDYLIRGVESADPSSGIVTLAQEVCPGQTIQFQVRNPSTAREELVNGVEEIKYAAQSHDPLFAFYFESLGRGLRLHKEADHDIRIIREGLGDTPLIGFLSNAEFAPWNRRNVVHTYSAALTLVCRRGPDQS